MKYTKAGMLNYLKQNMTDINILPTFVVSVNSFKNRTYETIQEIINFSNHAPMIVRSSSLDEDKMEYSNAGKYESVLNVYPCLEQIKEAVERVCDSYSREENEEILIQPMLENIRKSGVVFTADMDTYAEYYIVNYSESVDTTAVTGGNSGQLRTFIKYKFSKFPVDDPDMEHVLKVCSEIESFLQNDALDIEFAIDKTGKVFIFQVRMIARGDKAPYKRIDLEPALNRIYKKTKKLFMQHPFLLGHTTCFGVMPDWNPAEILGIRPKKLSISLYKELITDNIWAHQRADYGYRDLTMHPLMISFCGVPYIDTRITFNSFIPKNLNNKIAEKLVNYYLNKLVECPNYHDKVEFEIVHSCYYLGLHEKLKELSQYGFNENEITRIEFSLLELTNHIISSETGLYKNDIRKISVLEENYNKIMQSDISLVDKIYWLIEECKSYGTLPFAGVARAGFIAVQFLRSFVSTEIMKQEEYDAYMNSLETVNKTMNRCLGLYYRNKLSKEDFLEVYGHIRPGTYDIMSQRYDEAFDRYFENGFYMYEDNMDSKFEFTDRMMERIQIELEQNGLQITAEELIVFIKEAIEGREYLKFVFSKSVSRILQLIEELGIRTGIEKEDMAHLDISIVKQLYVDLYVGDIKTIFLENIRNNKIQYENAVRIKLPCIISKPEDVYSFHLLCEEPNFITQKNVTADVLHLKDSEEYKGKVLFIQAADPGYDYIFSKQIGGLVTQFGGVNSHMAIRCAELGIPAVIGVGEKNYKEWGHYKRITIDCMRKQVIKII